MEIEEPERPNLFPQSFGRKTETQTNLRGNDKRSTGNNLRKGNDMRGR